MRSVAIFGANGLLGRHLQSYIRGAGYRVMTVGRKKTSAVEWAIDFSQFSNVTKFLDRFKPDFVINLIAMTDVDACEESISAAFVANTHLVGILSDWCRSNEGSCLIQISTDHFYSKSGESLESDVEILNSYALTKYAGELEAKCCNSIVLRTNFFGRSLASDRRSFSDWIYNALQNREQITGFSDSYFSPLHMSTLCKAIVTVCDRPVAGVYNLGSRSGMSKGAFIVNVAKTLSLDWSLISIDRTAKGSSRAPRPLDMRMNTGKFQDTFPELELPYLADEILLLKEEYGCV